MAIASSDMLLKYSVVAAAGNTTASSQAASLGDQVSTTQPTDNSLNNWFGDYSAADNAGAVVRYRCLFIHNNHATDAWNSVVVYISGETALGVTAAISVDTTGVTAKGSGSAQAKVVANETTAPTSQTFTSPTTLGTALSVGTIAAGSVAAVWVRLTGINSAAVMPDSVALTFSGTT